MPQVTRNLSESAHSSGAGGPSQDMRYDLQVSDDVIYPIIPILAQSFLSKRGQNLRPYLVFTFYIAPGLEAVVCVCVNLYAQLDKVFIQDDLAQPSRQCSAMS